MRPGLGNMEVPGFIDAYRSDAGGSYFQRHYDPNLDSGADLGLQTIDSSGQRPVMTTASQAEAGSAGILPAVSVAKNVQAPSWLPWVLIGFALFVMVNKS